MLLVSGASATVQRHRSVRTLGRFVQPHDGSGPQTVAGFTWAGDNAAFSDWNADAFVEMLWRFRGVPGCVFVAAPDVVAIVNGEPKGDAAATLERYHQWRPLLAGWPRAFVLQDGQDVPTVPWDDIAAVFIGGSTAFKLGREVRTLVAYAKARGKWVHMGRVNTERRWRYAEAIGCDSVDGSGFSRWPDEMFRRWSNWTARREQQPALMGLA